MTTIEELRRYLRDESVDAWEEVDGLRFKAWISDRRPIAGAPSTSGSRRKPPSRRCPRAPRELIGKDPDVVEVFDLEATAEGRFQDENLSRLGLAFVSSSGRLERTERLREQLGVAARSARARTG